MIKRVLIANRGEIAVRIIRTLREMGIESVAVYSSEDAACLHVLLADTAIFMEGSVRETYLNGEKLADLAVLAGADAVHPGYGFLSESPEFAAACTDRGLIFIGPKADTIQKMGEKSYARRVMAQANVPIVPGTEEIGNREQGLEEAVRIGFPVMIKASRGGGGRGMRMAADPEEFLTAFDVAGKEAVSAFGDGTMYLEKYIPNPRHVEVQLLADDFGNVVILGERDCSVQRNHQKVIEETPAPGIGEELRERMFESARRAAKAAGYQGAGTCEFILDGEGNYYFIEMNTRIQVEHGVTEFATGTDIVREQIRIANGEKLLLKQEDIRTEGHVIEARLNAEDPENNFAPSPGRITGLHLPGGNGIRVDTALYAGYEIPSAFDSMAAKIIAKAPEREQAIVKLKYALTETAVEGIGTNREFLLRILDNREFREGKADTGLIERMKGEKE